MEIINIWWYLQT